MSDWHVVLGASPNELRYSFRASEAITAAGLPIWPIGTREGEVAGIPIRKDFPVENVDTLTLYLNSDRQKEYYEDIVGMKPNRVIFNPGTENPELEELLKVKGIAFERACTLVLLSTNQY